MYFFTLLQPSSANTNRQRSARHYTVGHKKLATLFFTITPLFLGGFLHFLTVETAKNTLQYLIYNG